MRFSSKNFLLLAFTILVIACKHEWPVQTGDDGSIKFASIHANTKIFRGPLLFHQNQTLQDILGSKPSTSRTLVTIPHTWQESTGYGTYQLHIDGGLDFDQVMALGVPFSASYSHLTALQRADHLLSLHSSVCRCNKTIRIVTLLWQVAITR